MEIGRCIACSVSLQGVQNSPQFQDRPDAEARRSLSMQRTRSGVRHPCGYPCLLAILQPAHGMAHSFAVYPPQDRDGLPMERVPGVSNDSVLLTWGIMKWARTLDPHFLTSQASDCCASGNRSVAYDPDQSSLQSSSRGERTRSSCTSLSNDGYHREFRNRGPTHPPATHQTICLRAPLHSRWTSRPSFKCRSLAAATPAGCCRRVLDRPHRGHSRGCPWRSGLGACLRPR